MNRAHFIILSFLITIFCVPQTSLFANRME